MGRYYGSEALRNPKLQKKAIDYALDKLNPMIQNVGSQALDQLSTKIRPNRKYKTDRKDLDGAGVDIHKLIGKIPKPKAGWTPGKYKYMGPYNPLDKQLEYDKNTGEVTKWYVQPYNKVDEIAAHHDICYDMGKNKGECDKQMVKSLDGIPYGQMPKWGQTARFLINTKQKLQSSPFLLGRLSHFTLLSLPSPPPFSMLDLHGLFFCSIVGQTFNIEKGGGGTSEKRHTLIYK